MERDSPMYGQSKTKRSGERHRSKHNQRPRFRLNDRHQRVFTIIFWVIIILIALYAFNAEMKHNSCYVDRTKDCMSPFYRNYPEPGDTNVDLLQKIENGTRIGEERTRWRKALLISFGIIFFTFILGLRRLPRPLEFTIGVAVSFILIYNVEGYNIMHYTYRVEQNTMRSINKLRENLGIIQLSDKCGMYGPSNTSGVEWNVCQRESDGMNRGKTL